MKGEGGGSAALVSGWIYVYIYAFEEERLSRIDLSYTVDGIGLSSDLSVRKKVVVLTNGRWVFGVAVLTRAYLSISIHGQS